MRALFDSLGRPVSKRVIANIMRLSDTDGNGMFFLLMSFIIYYASYSLTFDSIVFFLLVGTIDFGEFSAIFDKISCPPLTPEAAFKQICDEVVQSKSSTNYVWSTRLPENVVCTKNHEC